ncbi:hypothetical protein EVAR_31269_1 [Eumeta japonica]|uniref:Uncharacterized protein n=1 Tax=Eumeta variegata TaxID=151549 RepID=A0A4C1VTJ4_EUMVA|nr:hypothetical protein EVAR_31269_1 [Eumeta japonica]
MPELWETTGQTSSPHAPPSLRRQERTIGPPSYGSRGISRKAIVPPEAPPPSAGLVGRARPPRATLALAQCRSEDNNSRPHRFVNNAQSRRLTCSSKHEKINSTRPKSRPQLALDECQKRKRNVRRQSSISESSILSQLRRSRRGERPLKSGAPKRRKSTVESAAIVTVERRPAAGNQIQFTSFTRQ